MKKLLLILLLLCSPIWAEVSGPRHNVGTSKITNGTDTRCLFDDAGVLQEDAGCSYHKGADTLDLGVVKTATGPVIDVTHPTYGADPTGVADSTAEINAALAAAAAAGTRNVYAPEGTYKTSTALTVPNGVNFYGAGIDKTIISFVGVDDITIIGSSATDSDAFMRVADMTVNGGGANVTNAVGLRGRNNNVIERIRVTNIVASTTERFILVISGSGAWNNYNNAIRDSIVDNCTGAGCSGIAISQAVASGFYDYNSVIERNRVIGGQIGVTWWVTKGLVIRDNYFEANAYGFNNDVSGDGTIIVGNTVNGPTSIGLNIGGSGSYDGIAIENNQFINVSSTVPALRFQGNVTNATIRHNKISGSGSIGIQLASTGNTGFVIADNNIGATFSVAALTTNYVFDSSTAYAGRFSIAKSLDVAGSGGTKTLTVVGAAAVDGIELQAQVPEVYFNDINGGVLVGYMRYSGLTTSGSFSLLTSATGSQAIPTKLVLDTYANSTTPTNQQLKLSLLDISATEAYGWTISNDSGIWAHSGNSATPTAGYHMFATGGLPRLRIGSADIGIYGSTSGVVSLVPQAAAGTYNFNLPTTAGNSGECLTSAGGAAAAMTWTDPIVAAEIDTSSELAGIVGDETGTGALCFATNPAFAGTPTAPTAAGGTSTTQIATTAFVQGESPTTSAGVATRITDEVGTGNLPFVGVQAVTCTDNTVGASAQALTIQPTASVVNITNADPDGCDITMSETSPLSYLPITLVVISNAGGTVNFADSAGVSELAGAFNADIADTLSLIYTNSAFHETGRSAN